jgi:hypothetical protein
MIGREVTLFGKLYVWELYGDGVVNEGTPMVETKVQWRLERLCEVCRGMGYIHEPIGNFGHATLSCPRGCTPGW